jgi:putative pyruvate formate lyase activating enzyme
VVQLALFSAMFRSNPAATFLSTLPDGTCVDANEAFGLDGGEGLAPCYAAPGCLAEIERRAEAAHAALSDCHLCPRRCGVDRLSGQLGVCETGSHAIVASAFPHLGEENCLRGSRGSGTIFFGQCSLRCVFCQNADISQAHRGAELDAPALAALMLALQERGCHNINLVTPSHVVPRILGALALAIPLGLRLPLVYNTSAYDAVTTLRLLEGVVDIYLPDLKFFESATASRLAPDYPEHARAAIAEMQRQVGVLRLRRDGLAERGVLVRHLVLPGQGAESARALVWLADGISPDTYVNIMAQYHPAHRVGERAGRDGIRYREMARRPTLIELEAVHRAARQAGLWRIDEPRLP